MKNIIFIISLLLLTTSCQAPNDIEKMEEDLFNTDIEFSNLSKTNGRNIAFTTFCDENAVMLGPNAMPLEGKEIIVEKLFSKSDTGYTLTWQPVNAFVSESGELGYTYGLWNLETTDSTGQKISEQGTYATVWRKNEIGEWKFVLDTGNEGLSPKHN